VIVEGKGQFGVNLRRPIVTNGDFVASLCESAYSDRAVVWRGEGWVQAFMCYMEVHMPQGEGAVSGVVSGVVRHFRPILYNGDIRIQ